MKNKLMMFVLLGMILLSVSSVSALELNPFAEKKIYEPTLTSDVSDFIKLDFNEEYGTIKLSKTFFWIETDKIAEYSLIENTEQCLINCESKGKAVLYSDGKLFDDKYFLNKKGIEVNVDSKYYIKVIESYTEDVPVYEEVCSLQKVISNDTLLKGDLIEKNVCNQELTGYEKVEKTKEVWNEYNFEELKAGEYEWKIIGKKNIGQSVDFIPVAKGKSLNEWAWWNGDWEYKRQINLTANVGNFSYLYQVNYSENMQEDYDDLRFINSAEDKELNFTIQSYNSTSAIVRIFSQGETEFYMYYGNPLATSTSSASDIHFNPISYYYLDETSGTTAYDSMGLNNATNNGATIYQSGKINKAYDFEKSESDYITTPINSQLTNTPFSINMWFNAESFTEDMTLIGDRDSSGNNEWSLKLNSSKILSTPVYWNSAYQTQIASPTALTEGTWYMATLTYTTNNVKLYVNGVEKATDNSAILRPSNPNRNMQIGRWNQDTFQRYFDGLIDEVGIWNRTLTSDEISLLYTYTAPTYTIGAEKKSEGVSITLNSPADNLQSTSSTINFNATITPKEATIKNVTLYLNDEEYSDLYDTNETINYSKLLTLEDGDYTWNITACWIGESTEEDCTESETRTFEIDSVAPILTLNAPLTNFTTLTLPINVTLNFTASDSNLGSCWFSSSMNSTNTTFTCNTTQTIAFNSSGAHYFNYYSNDSFGNVASGTAPFYIYYVQPSATATTPITEGGISSHSFYLNMTNVANFNATAELYWNGTSYGLGTKTILSNDYLRFDKNIIVPSINGTSVNWTWFYNISGNPNVTNYNLTGSQTYIKVNITECGAGTYQILNYTLYDQETRALGSTANASIEVDLTLTSQANDSLSWQYHATKSSSTSFLICLPSGALNNSAYNLDSVAKYSYDAHVIQYNYIENFNLSSSSIPQTIKLYDLATAKSTSFLVNYQDENYIYVENAVIDVWRRYIGDGVFFSVEHGKTDANGQTRLHLVTEDIIYKFLVWQDGELVYTSPEFLALCQATPCQINLRQSTEDTNGFSERDNLIYDYDFNKTTRTASFTFATKDNTQTEINMTILSSNQYANETACTTSLTTSGGQIDCVIPTAFTNTSYQTIIYQDGQYFGTAFDSLAPSSMEIFGYTGLILTAIAYLMLALMGISSGIATIVFGIIGLVFMGLIQVFETGSVFGMASAIIWLIVAGIIIIIKITKRRIQ